MLVDLKKMSYIERGKFMKTMKIFTLNKKLFYLIMAIGYSASLFIYILGFIYRFTGKLEEMSDRYMFADKFYFTPLYLKIIDFFFLILMIYMHWMLYWAIGKLPLICKMVRVEQEDVIITAMDRDYLEEGFIYDGEKFERKRDSIQEDPTFSITKMQSSDIENTQNINQEENEDDYDYIDESKIIL